MEEGALTVGVLSGVFTTALLNSLKRNIVDPGIEKIMPSHKLDKQESFGDLFPLPTGTPEKNTDKPGPSAEIKWQTFLRDFITWVIIMFFLYIFWKNILHPLKPTK